MHPSIIYFYQSPRLHTVSPISLLFKVLRFLSKSQDNKKLYYFGITDVVLILQLPVQVQFLDGVIPANSLTCLMLDAKDIRHHKPLRVSERSGILHTFYIQKHAQNASNATVMQTRWKGWQNCCPFTVLIVCWERKIKLWVKQLSSQRRCLGCSQNAEHKKDEIPKK